MYGTRPPKIRAVEQQKVKISFTLSIFKELLLDAKGECLFVLASSMLIMFSHSVQLSSQSHAICSLQSAKRVRI